MEQLLMITKREADEIAFALVYASDFSHGTDGHSRLMLLAKLATAAGFYLDETRTLALPDHARVQA